MTICIQCEGVSILTRITRRDSIVRLENPKYVRSEFLNSRPADREGFYEVRSIKEHVHNRCRTCGYDWRVNVDGSTDTGQSAKHLDPSNPSLSFDIKSRKKTSGLDDATVLALAHRICTRYNHEGELPYAFNESSMLQLARAIENFND